MSSASCNRSWERLRQALRRIEGKQEQTEVCPSSENDLLDCLEATDRLHGDSIQEFENMISVLANE